MTRRAGFTLVELAVVLSVLAILVAVAVPRLQEAADRARAAALMERIRTIQTAVAPLPPPAGAPGGGFGSPGPALQGAVSAGQLRTAEGILLQVSGSRGALGANNRWMIIAKGSTPQHRRILYQWHLMETDDHLWSGMIVMVDAVRTPCVHPAANGCSGR